MITQGVDLDSLLSSHLRRGLEGTVLAFREATVVLDAGGAGTWTVSLSHGRGRARRGAAKKPTLTVTAAPDVLADVVRARTSGVDAFLQGRLTVRGDLALALQLDGLFAGDEERPHTHPRALEVRAMNVRTLYLEAGPPDAPPVLLLHGLGATNASLLPVLADLAVDHRVIAPDLPGFGATEAPSSPYNPAWFAAWVEAFQTATKSRGAVLIGNSLGGRIALEAGLMHPKSVTALVLLTPSPAFRRLRQWVPLVRFATPDLARLPMPQMTHRMIVEGIRAMFSEPDRLPRAWYDAAADEARRVLRKPKHRVAFFSCARQIYLEDAYGKNGFWQRLPGLTPPALFIWGDRDRLVPSSFARHVADALPSAGQVVLEDCGHVPQFEHPEDTMSMIRGFLEQI
ncbi:MAG: alpha/beta fold hydrolase [Actinobacteria bacterium]|nr:alpha/beta fold hydrolase [Actinomycetota bacterium]MCA1719711.1 alpha/beta fold hydrolase [Actinomycetota bacterium]